jgi:hypothetical protein
MTQDEIIEMAKQAGFDPHDMSSDFTCNLENINAFAKLVAEKEREACADLCEQYGFNNHCGLTTDVIATEIRARGQA